MENEPGVTDDGAWRGPEAAASPHLAPDPDPAPPTRRRGAPKVALAAAAALVLAGVLAWALAPRTTVVLPDGAEGGRALAPLQTAADPRTGEETAPFSGFAVSVDTVPAGALVTIDGVERGEAPVLAGIECSPGERVEIGARRRGLPPARAATTCRADTLVKLTVRLSR
jgi:hypothetical protein